MKTPAVQKLAWERHGFRAANFAGTDSISRFGVAGTLDQIPAVSELPNNDAMQHLITTLQSAQAKLVADISMYDTMYTQNAQQYRELKMTVLAGKKALADFNGLKVGDEITFFGYDSDGNFLSSQETANLIGDVEGCGLTSALMHRVARVFH